MARFGWCMDQLHKACRKTLQAQNDETVRCSCECHEREGEPENGD